MSRVLTVLLVMLVLCASGVVGAEPSTPANSATSPSSAELSVDPGSLLVDETVFERNPFGDNKSAHHAFNPTITASARVFYPKITMGFNPNLNNGVWQFNYVDNINPNKIHTASMNFSNVMNSGYIDLIGLSGLESQFAAAPELYLKLWDHIELSWTRFSGSGSAATPITGTFDGAAATVVVDAQTQLTMDMIGFQWDFWTPVKSNWLDINLLVGAQTFWPQKFDYCYKVPIPNMAQTVYSGSGAAPFPIGTPYYGIGADLQFGNLTLTGSYSGLAGLQQWLASATLIDLNYYDILGNANYAFTENISVDAGYRLFNLNPTLQPGFQQKWIKGQNNFTDNNSIDGYSFLLRAEGPYGGLTVRF